MLIVQKNLIVIDKFAFIFSHGTKQFCSGEHAYIVDNYFKSHHEFSTNLKIILSFVYF